MARSNELAISHPPQTCFGLIIPEAKDLETAFRRHRGLVFSMI
jgi:hypothetical protein